MADFWGKANTWWGDVSGRDQRKKGEQQMQQAAQTTGNIANVSEAQQMQNAQQAATGLAEQQGQTAAKQGSRAALQAARTSGLNAGQAALTSGQQAGDIYSGAYQGGLNAGMDRYGQATDRRIGAAGQQAQIGQADAAAGQARNQQLWGTVGNVAGAAAGMLSDENAKDIKGKPDIAAILNKIDPIRFTYKKDPEKVEHVGVTAQNLEQTPLAGAVKETPDGKKLDTGQLTGANTAMLADLHKRIAVLEARK